MGRPSVAQDLAKGRKIEVEHLNGYVVRRGADLGIPTPTNAAIVRLAKQVESGDVPPAAANVRLLLEPSEFSMAGSRSAQ